MTVVTHREFDEKTEALTVASKFPHQIKGKTVLITGGNIGGLGFALAKAFASQSPATIVIASRTPAKIEESINALKTEYPDVDYRPLKLDLSRRQSIRDAAQELMSWPDLPAINIMVNNAAIMNIPELTFSQDEPKVEIQFATNHLGHFLFTNLIMDKLIKSAETSPRGATRIVNVTSLSPTTSRTRWSDMNYEKLNKDLPESETPSYKMLEMFGTTDPANKSYCPLEGYSQSKIGNVLFSVGINNRLFEKYGILSIATHPGVIQTELSREASDETKAAIDRIWKSGFVSIKTTGAGAATMLVAATDPHLTRPVNEPQFGQENYGVFMIDCQISVSALDGAVSTAESDRMWALSEELVQQKFSY